MPLPVALRDVVDELDMLDDEITSYINPNPQIRIGTAALEALNGPALKHRWHQR
jgi:hypothetical protein